MDAALKDKLLYLADKYETADFLERDPSRFMHRYSRTEDRELAAFVAAALAFGRREQILSHVETILALAGRSPSEWVRQGGWKPHFPASPASFYRTYSHAAMRELFATLGEILQEKTLGDYFKEKWQAELKENATGTAGSVGQPASAAKGQEGSGQDSPVRPHRHLCQVIASCFPDTCTPIPHSEACAFKKLNMFLRWMVRDSSPVDMGLWSSWYSKADLLLPLDTHVMQEATRLGLLAASSSGKPKAASLKCARDLTAMMAEAFPGDPARGDYALFGLGVDG